MHLTVRIVVVRHVSSTHLYNSCATLLNSSPQDIKRIISLNDLLVMELIKCEAAGVTVVVVLVVPVLYCTTDFTFN